MMGNFWQPLIRLGRAAYIGSIAAIAFVPPSVAQRGLSQCQPPQGAEFLVLVFTPSQPLQAEVRNQVSQTLPENQQAVVCEYDGNVLSRVGGFTSLENATQWAEYFGEAVGLPLMVITPVDSDLALETSQAPTIPPMTTAIAPDLVVETTETPTRNVALPPAQPQAETKSTPPPATQGPTNFRPQGLRGGFGVLVEYGGNLAIANQLQRLMGQNIGLVAYGGRGYLLAAHTADSARITELLNRLNQNGLGAIAVPADQVILLKADISL
ncbi:hypothetical protein [Picosynechococcus sp. PCC 73109]|uniref:hypothetical protein n=1 Tax=Picosynechococcus sp. PCC 73109 TaxID=374982 RepID=UPI000A4938B6|nr:hypothetical protein [Picosynechococcus sp. PCC 73109]